MCTSNRKSHSPGETKDIAIRNTMRSRTNISSQSIYNMVKEPALKLSLVSNAAPKLGLHSGGRASFGASENASRV